MVLSGGIEPGATGLGGLPAGGEPVSADVVALAGFVEGSVTLLPGLRALAEELEVGRARVVGVDLVGFAVGSAIGRLGELLAAMGSLERFVAGVVDGLQEADGAGFGVGWWQSPAAVLAAQFGSSAAGELERAARAFGLSRAAAVGVVGAHFDEVAGRGGDRDRLTVEDLVAVADDPSAPGRLRDAAYRLAGDAGLFNDLDVARQTDLTATPLRGFAWSQADGVLGRDDFAVFATVDHQYRTLAPWHPLLDTADRGYDTSRADGRIGDGAVAAFVADPDIPLHVRAVVHDLYRHRVTLIDPRELDARTRTAGGPASGFVTPGPVAVPPVLPPGARPTAPPAAPPATPPGVAPASGFVAAALLGWGVARPTAVARASDPAVVHVHPVTGRVTRFELELLDALTPAQRKAWVAHVAAFGHPPEAVAGAVAPFPFLDAGGRWRWSNSGELIHHTGGDGPEPDLIEPGPNPDHTYLDPNGDYRYRVDGAMWDGYDLSPTERHNHPRADDLDAATFTIDGVTYPRHQVAFHPLCDDNNHHITLQGQPLYRLEPLGASGHKANGSDSLIKQSQTGWWHLDLENPPGRPGQLHLQYTDKSGRQQRFVYDFHADTFLPSRGGASLSKRELKQIRGHDEFPKAIMNARRKLNVGGLDEQC